MILAELKKAKGPSGWFDNLATMRRECWADGVITGGTYSSMFIEQYRKTHEGAIAHGGVHPWGHFPDLPREAE